MKKIFLVMLLLAISSAAEAQSLLGKWYGKSTQEGINCWMVERKSDNTYKTIFIGYDEGGALVRHMEEGTWFLGNGFYMTLTQKVGGRLVNLSDRGYRDVYNVISLDNSKFTYQAVGGLKFTVLKVKDSFELKTICPDLSDI